MYRKVKEEVRRRPKLPRAVNLGPAGGDVLPALALYARHLIAQTLGVPVEQVVAVSEEVCNYYNSLHFKVGDSIVHVQYVPERNSVNFRWERKAEGAPPLDFWLSLDWDLAHWPDMLELYARHLIAQTLGVSVEQVEPLGWHSGGVCDSDYALHFKVGDSIVHVDYTYDYYVTFEWEVECPVCGKPKPASKLWRHIRYHLEKARRG